VPVIAALVSEAKKVVRFRRDTLITAVPAKLMLHR
jgi:hypothetical protein